MSWIKPKTRISKRDGETATRRGFTLVETLITVTILTILASVALTAARSTGTQSIESLARIVAADLRLTRSLAIQYNTDWTVQFDLTNNAYELVHTGAGTPPMPINPLVPPSQQDGTYRVGIDSLNPAAPGSGDVRLRKVALSDSELDVVDVTFGPLGGTGPARNEDTVLWLNSDSGQSLQITISWVTGQVWLGATEIP